MGARTKKKPKSTRGRPRITSPALAAAVAEVGEGSSPEDAAEKHRVSARTVRRRVAEGSPPSPLQSVEPPAPGTEIVAGPPGPPISPAKLAAVAGAVSRWPLRQQAQLVEVLPFWGRVRRALGEALKGYPGAAGAVAAALRSVDV